MNKPNVNRNRRLRVTILRPCELEKKPFNKYFPYKYYNLRSMMFFKHCADSTLYRSLVGSGADRGGYMGWEHRMR